MVRWLSALFLALSLFGVADVGATSVDSDRVTTANECTAPFGAGADSLAPTGEAPPPSALDDEVDAAFDVTALADAMRGAAAVPFTAVMPRQHGWAAVSPPYLEGLRRPPRR